MFVIESVSQLFVYMCVSMFIVESVSQLFVYMCVSMFIVESVSQLSVCMFVCLVTLFKLLVRLYLNVRMFMIEIVPTSILYMSYVCIYFVND